MMSDRDRRKQVQNQEIPVVIVNPNYNPNSRTNCVKKYQRGKFLGKVSLGWVARSGPSLCGMEKRPYRVTVLEGALARPGSGTWVPQRGV